MTNLDGAWTQNEFKARLLEAGWKSVDDIGKTYLSPHGTIFQMDEDKPPIGPLWLYYALREELPPSKPKTRKADYRPPRGHNKTKGRPSKSPPKKISPKPPKKETVNILRFIDGYKKAHDGNSPSVREIIDGCERSSTSVAHYHLRRLEKLGAIKRSPNAARSIELVGTLELILRRLGVNDETRGES